MAYLLATPYICAGRQATDADYQRAEPNRASCKEVPHTNRNQARLDEEIPPMLGQASTKMPLRNNNDDYSHDDNGNAKTANLEHYQ